MFNGWFSSTKIVLPNLSNPSESSSQACSQASEKSKMAVSWRLPLDTILVRKIKLLDRKLCEKLVFNMYCFVWISHGSSSISEIIGKSKISASVKSVRDSTKSKNWKNNVPCTVFTSAMHQLAQLHASFHLAALFCPVLFFAFECTVHVLIRSSSCLFSQGMLDWTTVSSKHARNAFTTVGFSQCG